MIKTTRVFQIFFSLSLLHSIKCSNLDIELENRIRSVSKDSCSEYFKFARIDDFINGNLTLPNMKIGDEVKMIFLIARNFYCSSSFKGFLSPAGSSQEINDRVHNGQPISYRLDFPVVHNFPFLFKIFINDNELCATKANVSESGYTEEIVFQHTLEIISNSLPDLTHNPYIRSFAEVSSCGLANTKFTINGVSPLTYGLTEISHGRHPWPSAFYERQAALMALRTNRLCDGSGSCKGNSGDVLMFNRNGCWMPQNMMAAGLIFQQCSKHMQQNTMYCDLARHISRFENYIVQQEQPVIGPLEEVCGKSGTQSRSENPWLVVVYYKHYTGLDFHCTGVLISSRSVLAIGNLNYPSYMFRVHLGRYNLSNVKEYGVVAREIATIITHSNNRLAILQMKGPVGFTQFIKPICLQTEQTDTTQLQIFGQSASVIGWRSSKLCEKPTPQSEDVKIASTEQCKLTFGEFHQLCIPRSGNARQDFLILKRNGRWILRGVYAYQHTTDFYFYDDLAEHLLWIQNNM